MSAPKPSCSSSPLIPLCSLEQGGCVQGGCVRYNYHQSLVAYNDTCVMTTHLMTQFLRVRNAGRAVAVNQVSEL